MLVSLFRYKSHISVSRHIDYWPRSIVLVLVVIIAARILCSGISLHEANRISVDKFAFLLLKKCKDRILQPIAFAIESIVTNWFAWTLANY
jgi:hypothetical protein